MTNKFNNTTFTTEKYEYGVLKTKANLHTVRVMKEDIDVQVLDALVAGVSLEEIQKLTSQVEKLDKLEQELLDDLYSLYEWKNLNTAQCRF